MRTHVRLIGPFIASTAAVFMTEGSARQAVAEVSRMSPPASGVISPSTSSDVRRLADSPLTTPQQELLTIAFDIASAIPVEPHIKTRSKTQEAVAAACFQLDQPHRALECIERIDNWQRGCGYAEYAFYCARKGDSNEVQRYLDLAVPIAMANEDWRRDQILVKVAMTHAWLGDESRATAFESGVVESESGKANVARAMRATDATVDALMGALDAILAGGGFDLSQNALSAYAVLYDRFYDDRARRDVIAQRISASWHSLPVLARVDLMLALAAIANGHLDHPTAIAMASEVQQVLDGHEWMPEDRIPVVARLASVRFVAGERDAARAELDASLAGYATERGQIANIYRAETLTPIAEAYDKIGDAAAALAVYKQAVEESIENPNSRPRAEDLGAICCSMAVNGVEPDAALWARIHQIRDGLGRPW